jgi:hypothetical protein
MIDDLRLKPDRPGKAIAQNILPYENSLNWKHALNNPFRLFSTVNRQL